MVRFVESGVDDAGAHALLAEYFAERAAGFPAAQGSYRTAFPLPEQFVPPAGVFLVLRRQAAGADDEPGPLLGCGGIRRVQRGDAGLVRFEVKHLYLRPAERGRGHGGLLLAELERRAVALGAGEIVLDTNASLASAGALYRRAGYRDIPAYNANPNATNWYGKALGGRAGAQPAAGPAG